MKIALMQQVATFDRDENRRRGLARAQEAAAHGADLICFAELAFDPFYPQKPPTGPVQPLGESVPGPATSVFTDFARDAGVVVVLNLYERQGNLMYDSSPVIDADGTLLGVTRMVHITDYPCFHEKAYYTPGDRGVPVYQTAAGMIGIAICYDRHFPEYMRALALGGAEVVVVPQAGAVGEWPEGLYEAEMRVAAFQNGYYAALCNRVGAEECLTFSGESFVCDPSGRVVARAGSGTEEILYADIDVRKVTSSHARQLFMRDRRPELYADWFRTT